jgi:hypothetical protein
LAHISEPITSPIRMREEQFRVANENVDRVRLTGVSDKPSTGKSVHLPPKGAEWEPLSYTVERDGD